MTSNSLASRSTDFFMLAHQKLLENIAIFWFVLAVLGQWIFAAYVIVFYGGASVEGNFERWNKVLPHGYVAGDFWGNLVVGIHVLFAAVIIIGGPLQLVPQIRKHFRSFHRWNGKVYLLTVLIAAISGLVMVWTRGAVGDTFMHVGISTNALLIIICAFFSYKNAINRQFDTHYRWTLRLFMVANGVWFFRVGLMAWLLIHQAPVGFDMSTFSGPFLWTLSSSVYIIPLPVLLLELYWKAKNSTSKALGFVTATILLVFTLLMGAGIFAATMGMWTPRIF